MARPITKYLDSRGKEHADEAAADRADLRYRAEEVLAPFCDDHGIDLERVESFNRETLQPLIDYFSQLAVEAAGRMQRLG